MLQGQWVNTGRGVFLFHRLLPKWLALIPELSQGGIPEHLSSRTLFGRGVGEEVRRGAKGKGKRVRVANLKPRLQATASSAVTATLSSPSTW